MSARFRIRTSAGQELSFASQEMFEDFVRAGELSYDDLVYDREDGSWAPAPTHPLVLEIEYGDLSLVPEEPQAGDPETEEPVPESPGDRPEAVADDFGLELVAPEEISPQEAARQFVERLEAERAEEREFEGSDRSVSGFTTRESSTVSRVGRASAPPARPVGVPRSFGAGGPVRRPRAGSLIGAERRPDPRGLRRREVRGAAPAEGRRSSSVIGMAVMVAVLGGGGYLGFQLSQDGAVAQATPADAPVVPIRVEPTPEPPPPDPAIIPNEASVRERARERFLTATRAELRSLPEIPAEWPGGRYLTLPSASPDVPRVWGTYLATVRRVRAGDYARYRRAFEAALDDALISGEDRRIWLGRAVLDFGAAADRRHEHYTRVEALASAAIRSHQVLLEAEGLLLYDGPGDGLRTETLGADVTGRDAESNVLLQQVIELLSTHLDADGRGPRSGTNVRAWVWDGLLDAVAG